MPIAYRRCFYIADTGIQCETWFEAVDNNKLCEAHRQIISPNGKNEDIKVKYIDLVNDERKYCYHFLDGTSQNQSQALIYEFKDDLEGSVFEKLDQHIGFIEKVIEDLRARLHSARAVRSEKLDELSDDQRKELRKHRIEKAVDNVTDKPKSFKKDPVGHL